VSRVRAVGGILGEFEEVRAGHSVDLGMATPTAMAAWDMWIAYDTTMYPAKVQLP
jgi:hypothetical protein